MEKAEIVAGLRSAMSRGYSLEFAKKSFINAGYNSQDVEDSASILVSGGAGAGVNTKISSLSSPQPQTASHSQITQPHQTTSNYLQTSPNQPTRLQPTQQMIITPAASPYKPLPRMPSQNEGYKRTTDEIGRPRRKGLWLVITLIIIFLIVLGVLGLLLFNRELVEAYLSNWGLI